MKRLAIWIMVAAAMVLVAGTTEVLAQGTFKVPFPFQSGDLKLPKGDYSVFKRTRVTSCYGRRRRARSIRSRSRSD